MHSAVSRPSSPGHGVTPPSRILCRKKIVRADSCIGAHLSAPPWRKRSNGQFAGFRSSDGRGGAAHALQHARRQHGEPFDATHLHVLRRAPTGSRRRSRHVCSKVSACLASGSSIALICDLRRHAVRFQAVYRRILQLVPRNDPAHRRSSGEKSSCPRGIPHGLLR